MHPFRGCLLLHSLPLQFTVKRGHGFDARLFVYSGRPPTDPVGVLYRGRSSADPWPLFVGATTLCYPPVFTGEGYLSFVDLLFAVVCDIPRTEFSQKGKPPGRLQICPVGWFS